MFRYGLQCHTMMPPNAERAQLFPLDHPPDAAVRHPPSLSQLADRENFLVHFTSIFSAVPIRSPIRGYMNIFATHPPANVIKGLQKTQLSIPMKLSSSLDTFEFLAIMATRPAIPMA